MKQNQAGQGHCVPHGAYVVRRLLDETYSKYGYKTDMLLDLILSRI
jgi:hypothetical protein